jgi:serine/threonine protein phosphatase PrpC
MEKPGDESIAGCTANVIIITDTEIYCANAGDSRSILRIENVYFNNIFINIRKLKLYQKIINLMI